MPNMRTLTVDGTTYDIKDATARSEITTLQTNVTQLQTNVTQLQTNVTQLQNNTADLPQIRENVENNADDIRDLKSAIAKNQIYDTASGSIASFPDGADDEPIKELIVNVDPAQYGTGDPSPDNVRPISGWNSVKVTRTGKNLLDESIAHTSNANCKFGGLISATVPDGTLKLPAGTYTVSLSESMSGIYVGDKSGTTIATAFNKNNLTFTLSEYQACNVLLYKSGITIDYWSTIKTQIEIGSVATAYEPYQGETYEIEIPSEAGTVYGGTLTINEDGTGKVEINIKKIRINNFSGSFGITDNGFVAYATINDLRRQASAESDNCYCNQFTKKYVPFQYMPVYSYLGNSGATATCVFVLPNTIQNIAQANEWISNLATPLEMTYISSNPISFELTTQEVIKTLYGNNNIWADTGDVSVTYPADLKLYIDKVVAG